jgi:hypothetical protein
MNDNTELKILDELLNYLLTTEINGIVELRNDTIKKSDFLKNVNNFTFKSALLKLTKDGYVTETSNDSIDPIFNNKRTDCYYDISFEGMFFIKKGGYEKQNAENLKKETEYENIQTEQRKQASVLVRLNRWLVFGAIVVAIDSVLNILNFFGIYFDTSNLIFCVKPT